MVWSVRPERLVEAQRFLTQISAEWDARIDTLRDLVEGDDVGASPKILY